MINEDKFKKEIKKIVEYFKKSELTILESQIICQNYINFTNADVLIKTEKMIDQEDFDEKLNRGMN